jgi:hypothetical protein
VFEFVFQQVLDADTQLSELAEENEVELTLVVRFLVLGLVVNWW